MLWSFKYNGNGHHGYHNKNRAVKGLKLWNKSFPLGGFTANGRSFQRDKEALVFC